MGRRPSYVRSAGSMIATVVAIMLMGALPALAATARPDAHDRGLAVELAAKVAAFRAVAGSAGGTETTQLDKCPYLKQHPNQAFSAAITLLPALLAIVVNEYKPELLDLQATLAGMHPDSKLFARWLSTMRAQTSFILEFDNHGKKIDLCRAATVLNGKSKPADYKRVTGLDPSLVLKLFSGSAPKPSASVNTEMKTFFLQAGLSKKDATALTS